MPTIALLGGAHIHTPNFTNMLANAGDIETRYVWDPDKAVAKARQEITGGKLIDSPEQALADSAVDGVVICSQTSRHEDIVTAAVKAKKAMFVEKPLGMGAADANRMAQQIEEAGVIFQTGYFLRGQPQMQFVRQAVLAGALGRITRIRMSNCHDGVFRGLFDKQWSWMADPEQAGCGAFGDLGTHVLDLIMWINDGDDVIAATAALGSAMNRYENCDEYGEGLLRFKSGALATLAGGWVDLANPNFLEISGTEGHARITGDKLYIKSDKIPGGDGQTPIEELPKAWTHAFELYLDALRGKNVSLVKPLEAAKRNVVMEAMYKGAQTLSWASLR